MASMTRRDLTFALAAPGFAQDRVKREVFVKSPGKGTAAMAYAFALDRGGKRMLSFEQRWSRSDTIDVAYRRESSDFGQTWSAPVEYKTGEKRPEGMLRRHPRGVWVDPKTGRAIELWLEAVLPNDDPLEGLSRWRILYTLDGSSKRQLDVQRMMLGDMTCRPIRFRDEILLPVSRQPIDASGKLYNPGGGYTWHDTAVLHLTLDGNVLSARISDTIVGDPAVSTRGFVEPTIAELDGGRLMMAMRGSNDKRPELSAYKWISFSTDGGWKWSKPVPWTFDDGGSFYSPSACSQLLPDSAGRLFWIGNITKENPRGNRPRYPMTLGRVDRRTGLLRRSSLLTIDDLQAGENPQLSLSNFYAREDSRTKEICIHMTRLFALPDGWEGDAMLYRVTV